MRIREIPSGKMRDIIEEFEKQHPKKPRLKAGDFENRQIAGQEKFPWKNIYVDIVIPRADIIAELTDSIKYLEKSIRADYRLLRDKQKRLAVLLEQEKRSDKGVQTMRKSHPGFKGAVKSVMNKEGVSEAAASRIIGDNKAHASAAAKRANPKLLKKGGK